MSTDIDNLLVQKLMEATTPAEDTAVDVLREILEYRGGAANALEDEYVMERAQLAAAAPRGVPLVFKELYEALDWLMTARKTGSIHTDGGFYDNKAEAALADALVAFPELEAPPRSCHGSEGAMK